MSSRPVLVCSGRRALEEIRMRPISFQGHGTPITRASASRSRRTQSEGIEPLNGLLIQRGESADEASMRRAASSRVESHRDAAAEDNGERIRSCVSTRDGKSIRSIDCTALADVLCFASLLVDSYWNILESENL